MPKSEIYISYPPEGKRVIPAGMLEIDWKNGIAYLPDGNKEALSALLPPDKIMKSLLIMTEHTGILKLLFGEQKNIHAPIFPSMSTIRNIFFDRTLFEVSEASRIYMLASTDPTGPSIDEMRQPMPVVFGYASEWESLWEVDEIPPGKVVAYDAYTVPEGHRLLFKGGYAFCSIGCVQKVFLTKTPGILGSF